MRLQEKILKLYRLLLHATKESGLYFVGNREPSWISKLSDVIPFTSPEAQVWRVRGKADKLGDWNGHMWYVHVLS